MANDLLTPTIITRKALMILHQKLSFVGSINRGYDDQFAKDGAKIGETLRIRKPVQYTVGDGAVITPQETTETYESLTVDKQKHVPMVFSTNDLTLKIDDFSDRYIEPAMAVLAAAIERDVLTTMRLTVYNQVNNVASTMALAQVGFARKRLVDNLAPPTSRFVQLNTNDHAYLIEANKGLFNPQDIISKQYRESGVGRTAGFDFYESTHMDTQLVGTRAGYITDDLAGQSGAVLHVDTGTGTALEGEVFTIGGVFRVHPETKVSSGILQQFVLTADFAGGEGDMHISPAIVATGAYQNVSNVAADGQALTFVGTASTAYGQSLSYHKDAFTFATADLFMPKGLDFAAREVYDGISLRILRDFDITNDKLITRCDVLYGRAALRPQLATRIANTAPAQ